MNTIFAMAVVVMKEMVRRKDFYVLFIITALITLVMGAINIFNDKTIAGYLKELALLLIWICSLVMAITASARQVYAEKENRTIFPLLAKPVSRAQFLLGKFLGCWLACGLALLVFYLFLGVVAASREHSLDAANPAQLVFHNPGDFIHRFDAQPFRRADEYVEVTFVCVARNVFLTDRLVERD